MTDEAYVAYGDGGAQGAFDDEGLPPGFARQASRLLESARANERAVRDLEQAVQLLAEGAGELAACEGLAQALAGAAGQVERIERVAGEVGAACEAAGDLEAATQAVHRATEAVGRVSGQVEALSAKADALAESVGALDARLTHALEVVEALGEGSALASIARLEARVGRLVELLEAGTAQTGCACEGRGGDASGMSEAPA